jgi:hypothetical protein
MRKSPFLRVSVSPSLRFAVFPVPCSLSPVPFLSPFATRYSLLAVVSARQEPRPPISFRLPSHSKFGRANLPVSPKLLEGASPDAPKFFRQCGSTALQKTIRYSPSFPLASPFHRFSVSPCPSVHCPAVLSLNAASSNACSCANFLTCSLSVVIFTA